MNKTKAFTLMELLVSMAIFSTIAVVLYSCFRGGVISFRRVEEQAEFQQKLRHVLLKITNDFKNMAYVSNIPFEGYIDKTSFVTTMSESDNADMNVGRVSYYLQQGKEGQVLVRKVESLKAALGSLSMAYEDIEEGILPPPKKEEPAILEGVIDLKLTYLSLNTHKTTKEGGVETADIEYEWVDFWEIEDGLPLGIKVELSVLEFKDGRQIRFYRQISIPTNRTPDTVLAGLNVTSPKD